MKLFYKSGACSLASHIILHEVGGAFGIVEVDTEAGTTATGLDYASINPKGYVPALQLDSGDVLSEGAAILQFIADQHADLKLTPAAGSLERARLQEHLNYTSSELHKAFGPFFSSTSSEADKDQAKANVTKKFDYLDALFSDNRMYLLGDQFTVADAYMFVVCNWSNFVGIDLSEWPSLSVYVDRVAKRPATQSAMKAEGLVN